MLGGLILGVTLVAYDCTTSRQPVSYRRWILHAIQFLLGALYSAYVVFYFQSATPSPVPGAWTSRPRMATSSKKNSSGVPPLWRRPKAQVESS